MVESWKSTPPLPETGVLANNSSDFSLVGQPAVHTDLFMEVAPQSKKSKAIPSYFWGVEGANQSSKLYDIVAVICSTVNDAV